MVVNGDGAARQDQASDLQLLVNSVPGLIHTGRPDGYLDFFNQPWLRYVGRPLEDLQGWNWTAFIHPEDVEGIVQKWRASLASGEQFLHEARVLRADGEYRWMLHHKVAARDGCGQIVKWHGSSIDIEDQEFRRREVYLAGAQRLSHTGSFGWNSSGNPDVVGAVTDTTERKTTEDRIRRLVDAGFLGIFLANLTGEIVEANPAFLEMFQYDRQDLISGQLRWEDMTPAEFHERDQHAVTEALATGFFQPYEKQFFRKDGSRLPVLLGGALFQDSNQGVSFVLDLSEQKRAEEKIRAQEMEFQQILDLVPQLVSVYGPNRERLYANRGMLDYLGLSLEEWRTRSKFGHSLHPDDWDPAIGHFDGAVSNGDGFDLELRLRKGDGSYRWFLARCNPVCDDKGQIMRWYLACTDIDDRKLAEQKLQQENIALREEIDKASMFEEIVGTSRPLKTVLSQIARVAPTGSTVLITGETGTGKELIARAVHKRSQRSGRPFISVNCAALPPALVSSELFGHEKGAFTGATQRRLGRFEMADGGTIFLDEVGELLPDTQAALLRVLQEREFERVGGGQPIHTDVRVIAATNRDLNAAVANGTFRQDLLYRLNVFPIEIPPLRERSDDILILVEYFVQRYANRAGKDIRSIDQRTLDLLQSYDWPGNIRELQNVIERSIILSSSDVFSVDELWLSKRISQQASRVETPPAWKVEPRSEREIIEAALAECRGRVSGAAGAAAKLRIPASTLATRIRTLKINKDQFKFPQ
jgi:PAS domain S-box-containing protein